MLLSLILVSNYGMQMQGLQSLQFALFGAIQHNPDNPNSINLKEMISQYIGKFMPITLFNNLDPASGKSKEIAILFQGDADFTVINASQSSDGTYGFNIPSSPSGKPLQFALFGAFAFNKLAKNSINFRNIILPFLGKVLDTHDISDDKTLLDDPAFGYSKEIAILFEGDADFTIIKATPQADGKYGYILPQAPKQLATGLPLQFGLFGIFQNNILNPNTINLKELIKSYLGKFMPLSVFTNDPAPGINKNVAILFQGDSEFTVINASQSSDGKYGYNIPAAAPLGKQLQFGLYGVFGVNKMNNSINFKDVFSYFIGSFLPMEILNNQKLLVDPAKGIEKKIAILFQDDTDFTIIKASQSSDGTYGYNITSPSYKAAQAAQQAQEAQEAQAAQLATQQAAAAQAAQQAQAAQAAQAAQLAAQQAVAAQAAQLATQQAQAAQAAQTVAPVAKVPVKHICNIAGNDVTKLLGLSNANLCSAKNINTNFNAKTKVCNIKLKNKPKQKIAMKIPASQCNVYKLVKWL